MVNPPVASRPLVKEAICQPRSTTHFLEVQVHREHGAHTPHTKPFSRMHHVRLCAVRQTAVSSVQRASLQQQSAVAGAQRQHRAASR